MPPSASISCGKFSKLTSTRWLTWMPRYCSTVRIASAGPPIRVGGVDLVLAVAGDVDDGVARDRERRVVAAADPHQQDRVRARRLADLVRARLLGALGARVGAEHEDRVRRGQRVAARRRARCRRRSETFDDWICAETRKRTSEIASQATSAASSQRTTRQTLIRRRRAARGACGAGGCGGAPRSPRRRLAPACRAGRRRRRRRRRNFGLGAVERVLGLVVVARVGHADR